MPAALIFDLDGTLVESLPGIASALNLALGENGLPVHGHPAVRTFIGNGVRELLRRAAGPAATEPLLDALERSFKHHYDTAWRTGTVVFPGIREMLAELAAAGHPLAVLSNKPHDFTVDMVAGLFPETEFSAVLGQRPGVPRKPDPAGALEIAAAIAMPPGRCVFIGDSTIDVETGAAARMRTLAVTWGYHDARALWDATAVVADVPELLHWLRSHAI